MKGRKYFQYGTRSLPILQSVDPLVPKRAIEVILEDTDKDALAIALNHNYPALLIGEAGTGKTSIVRYLAYKRQQAYVRVSMTGFTTPDELVGTKSVKKGETYFEHGVITDAMARGAMLVLDEINATAPDCLFILHGLLDEDRRITLPNGEVIFPHQDFRVFATMNPNYEGTRSLNKAFLDRFPIVIAVDVLLPVKEIALLMERTGIEKTVATELVTVASLARRDYEEQKILTYVSTRSLLHVGELIHKGLSPRVAYETTVVRKGSNKEEAQLLADYYLSVVKQAEGSNKDTVVITTQRELAEKENLIRSMQEQLATAQKGTIVTPAASGHYSKVDDGTLVSF